MVIKEMMMTTTSTVLNTGDSVFLKKIMWMEQGRIVATRMEVKLPSAIKSPASTHTRIFKLRMSLKKGKMYPSSEMPHTISTRKAMHFLLVTKYLFVVNAPTHQPATQPPPKLASTCSLSGLM